MERGWLIIVISLVILLFLVQAFIIKVFIQGRMRSTKNHPQVIGLQLNATKQSVESEQVFNNLQEIITIVKNHSCGMPIAQVESAVKKWGETFKSCDQLMKALKDHSEDLVIRLRNSLQDFNEVAFRVELETILKVLEKRIHCTYKNKSPDLAEITRQVYSAICSSSVSYPKTAVLGTTFQTSDSDINTLLLSINSQINIIQPSICTELKKMFQSINEGLARTQISCNDMREQIQVVMTMFQSKDVVGKNILSHVNTILLYSLDKCCVNGQVDSKTFKMYMDKLMAVLC